MAVCAALLRLPRETCCTETMVTEYMNTVDSVVREVLGDNYDPRQLWNSDEKPFNPVLEAGKGRNSGTFLGGVGDPAPVVVTDPDKSFFTGELLVPSVT